MARQPTDDKWLEWFADRMGQPGPREEEFFSELRRRNFKMNLNPYLIEIRPNGLRNGHVEIEVWYAGVSVGDTLVPEKATLSYYVDSAHELIERNRSRLSAHKQMQILENERENSDGPYDPGDETMAQRLFSSLAKGRS